MKKKKKNNVKIITIILAVILFLGAGAGIFYYFRINSKDAESVVSVSVNPQIQLTLNASDRVVEVNCLNDDAETLLISTELQGKTVQEATKIIVELSTKAGYIDINTNGTRITVSAMNLDENKVKEIENKCINSINKFFDENGIIAGAVAKGKEIFDASASALNISVEEYALRMQAVNMGLVENIDELANTTQKEILNMIHEYNTEYQGIMSDALTDLKATLEAIGVNELREDIAEYEHQLAQANVSEYQKATIQLALDLAKNSLDLLQVQIDAAFELARQVSENLKVSIENTYNALITANEEKINNHKQQFNENKESVQNLIQAYRETLIPKK